MKKILRLLQLVERSISWIQRVFILDEIRPIGEYQYLIWALYRVGLTRGPTAMVNHAKAVRLALLHFLSGEFPSKRVEGVRVTRDGVPLILGPLVDKIRRGPSPALLRIVNTILFSTRSLNLGKDVDLTPIEGPILSDRLPDFGKVAHLFWRELGYRPSEAHVPGSLAFKKYHFTVKAGPNGQALWSSLADLWLITPEMENHLFVIGGQRLRTYIQNLLKVKDFLSTILPSKGTTLRRLVWFPDKELKTRVIAIGDFWSQTALKPLHHYLFRVLTKIPQDCTFDQSRFVSLSKDWKVFYSVDLSNATDRFPIQSIFEVLNGQLPREYCESWRWLIVGLPFDFNGRKVSYAVGNPIGFYSSWSSFAVSHHFVMWYCCRELGIQWKDAKYCLLGDDILIGDTPLYEKYLELIDRLGVKFSPLKTHSSTKLFEFTKRLFFCGVEITPFPISALKEVSKGYYLLVNFFLELETRGWNLIEGIPQGIQSFYRIVIQRNSVFSATMSVNAYFSERIMKVIRGIETANTALISSIRNFNYQIPEIGERGSDLIFQSLAIETFTKSIHRSRNYHGPDIVESLLMKITGVEDPLMLEHLINITHHIPQLAVRGQVEEIYLRVSKEAFRISVCQED